MSGDGAYRQTLYEPLENQEFSKQPLREFKTPTIARKPVPGNDIYSPHSHGLHQRSGVAPETRPRLYWRIPALMVSSLLIGVIFALGNHFFYLYWNQKVVGRNSQQQWVIRGGTAFAFGAKVALTVATSTAFVQQMWSCLLHRVNNVGEIDTMFTVLANATEFFKIRTWLKRPLLALTALVTWIIPIAAIITPGTLVVAPILTSNTTQALVAQPDFQHNYLNYGTVDYSEADFAVGNTPSPELMKMALASATSQSILPITPPFENASYTLSFYGPALQCEALPDSDIWNFRRIAQAYTAEFMNSILYYSWSSGDFNSTCACPYNSTFIPALSSGISASTIMYTQLFMFFWTGSKPQPVMMSCSLYNASYEVDFAFEQSRQRLSVTKTKPLNPISTDSVYEEIFPPTSLSNQTQSYLSLMGSFNRIFEGSMSFDYHFGYSSAATLVQSTAIGQYIETDPPEPSSNKTICAKVEEVFQNITLSLMSSPSFAVDNSNRTLASPVPVVVRKTQNIYVYQPKDLYLAYGIAILAAAICVGFGYFSIFKNGLSFTNDFSTILCTTRHGALNGIMAPSDASGAVPRSKEITRVDLEYRMKAVDGDISGDVWLGFVPVRQRRVGVPSASERSEQIPQRFSAIDGPPRR